MLLPSSLDNFIVNVGNIYLVKDVVAKVVAKDTSNDIEGNI
jgi:hypothetical protein